MLAWSKSISGLLRCIWRRSPTSTTLRASPFIMRPNYISSERSGSDLRSEFPSRQSPTNCNKIFNLLEKRTILLVLPIIELNARTFDFIRMCFPSTRLMRLFRGCWVANVIIGNDERNFIIIVSNAPLWMCRSKRK